MNGWKFNKLYSSYIREAKNRGIEFNITIDKFKEIITKPCFYCGTYPQNPYSEQNKKNFNYNGIDRKDSSLNYTLDNIVPCCKICNRFKMDMDFYDFIKWVKRIHHQWIET